ncbi:hypothetical protein [Negadavirga shengliensis]|uniref:Thymidylate kinase n=1 Tax=Negadavirga shengliensis TaxID=1389218 RepID=A0ABV9T2D2_9BACT
MSKKIRFAHWKSNCRLVRSLQGKTDLDILVHPEDRRGFIKCLEELGYKKIQSPAWSSYPDVEDWLAMDKETAVFLHLHVHFSMVTGLKHVKHLYLPWTILFFKYIKTDELTGWPVPVPELEIIVLFIRIYAKMDFFQKSRPNPSIPSFLKEEIQWLWDSSETHKISSLCKELGLKVPGGLSSVLTHMADRPNDADILEISRAFYHQVRKFHRMNGTVAGIISAYYKFYLRVSTRSMAVFGPFQLRKRLPAGGKVIAFIGSDGSGKSSLANDVIKWLSYKIDCHYLYMGKNPHVKSGGKLLKPWDNFIYGEHPIAKKIRQLIGDFFFILRIRRKNALLRKARKLAKKGSVVICDRFPQIHVPELNDGVMLNQCKSRKLKRLEKMHFYKAIKNKADIFFRLVVHPETAHKRKPEHSMEMIQKKCEAFSNITFPNSEVIDIDANKPYDEVLSEIQQRIWKNL